MGTTRCRACGHARQDDTGFTQCPACGQAWKLVDRRNVWIASGLTFLGFVSGLWAAVISQLMGVSGHGWMSAAKVCWVGILAAPAAGVAWGLRRTLTGLGLVLILLVVLVTADFILLRLSQAEGLSYATRALSQDPLFSVSWFGWQVLVLGTLAHIVRDRIRKS